MDSFNCHNCHYTTNIIKNGTTSSGRQRYKCKICKKTWTNKIRTVRIEKSLLDSYIFSNMNIVELSKRYKLSEKTIRTKLKNYQPPEIIPQQAEVICMDVTYFRREWGILSVLDTHTGNCLYLAETNSYETVKDYEKAITFLHKHNIYPKVAIIDGKIGVIQMLESYGILVQFCQFHQLKIIK